jgi:hypothetical protein
LGRCNSDRKEPGFEDQEYGGGFGQGRASVISRGRGPHNGRGRGLGRRNLRNQ